MKTVLKLKTVIKAGLEADLIINYCNQIVAEN